MIHEGPLPLFDLLCRTMGEEEIAGGNQRVYRERLSFIKLTMVLFLFSQLRATQRVA